MELQTAIEILVYHQEWRLGKREEMIYEPKQITEALDVVLSEVKKNCLGSACCPLCGSEEYEEYEELMYENGIDDPQYGGELKMVKITDCRDCG